MTAPTHTSFGLLFILSLGLLLGITFNPALAFLATIGALLPDIDTPKSAIGRLMPPFSAWLERKIGHRQATHSLLALVMLSLALAPLIIINLLFWVSLLCGYLSHLIIDATNKSGVPLFYPSPLRAVVPKSEKYRIAVGSKGEIILFTFISITAFLILPINRVGLFQSLHYIIRDTRSAIADYRSWADEYRVYAIVSGRFNVSQQPIQAQFEVLGIDNQQSIVVYDWGADIVYTVGADKNANIYPKSIRCIKGEPILVITKRVHLENELLSNIIDHIPPEGQTFIKGEVTTTDKVILPQDPDRYETIRVQINAIQLRYSQKSDVEPLLVSTIFAISADLYLRTILPKTKDRHVTTLSKKPEESIGSHSMFHKAAVFSPAANSLFASKMSPNSEFRTPSSFLRTPVYTTEMYLHNVRNLEEILVSQGQYLKAGDKIAALTYNEAKLKLKEQIIHKLIAQLQSEPIDSHSLFLAAETVKAKKREYELKQVVFNATKKLNEVKAISDVALISEQQQLALALSSLTSAEHQFEQLKDNLQSKQKQRQYKIDQAYLKLDEIRQELRQNQIYSPVNARVLLIRTHAINNNNLTIAIKLLVNVEPPDEYGAEEPKEQQTMPRGSPKLKQQPPPKNQPESDNVIKAMEKEYKENPLSPPLLGGPGVGWREY